MASLIGIQNNDTVEFPINSSVSRLRYFFGQLLTQRDLQAEQSYHVVLQRLMQRESLGTGTVAGLEVRLESGGATLPKGVFIRPGLAMDPGGRELLLEQEVCIDVADDALTPAVGTGITGVDQAEVAASVQLKLEISFATGGSSEPALDELVDRLLWAGLITDAQWTTYTTNGGGTDMDDIVEILNQITAPGAPVALEPGQSPVDWVFEQLVGTTYVGLRYREIGNDPTPAVLDASCCGDVTCFPGRTTEGVDVITGPDRFVTEDPYADFKQCLATEFFKQKDTPDPGVPYPQDNPVNQAICECLMSAWRGLPTMGDGCAPLDLPVVCLAIVYWNRFPANPSLTPAARMLPVDNCSCRDLAPGAPMVRALLESFTGSGAPGALAPILTAIVPAEIQEIAPPSDTNLLTVTGTANADLTAASAASGWKMLHYSEGGGGITEYTGAGGPKASVVNVDVGVGPDTRQVTISFTAGTPGVPWDDGLYVWTLENDGSPAIDAASTGEELDGEPNPPAAVPSGRGQAGGAFTARFIVKTP